MRRKLRQVIDGARPDRHRNGLTSLQHGFQREHVLVFGIKLRLGEDIRFAAVMPGAAERFPEGLPSGGKCVRVGDQQGRLVAELLPKYLWRAAQHPLAQFNPTGFLRSAYGLG